MNEVSRAVLFVVLSGCVFVSIVLGHFLPPLGMLHDAQVLLVPVFLCYGALALTFPWVLALSFVSGLMWDLATVPSFDPAVEIPPGASILVYGLLCSLVHGMRPVFLKGRWEVHCLMSGVLASLAVLAEYALISFRRAGGAWEADVLWRILMPGALAIFIAPVVYLIFHFSMKLAGMSGWDNEDRMRS